MNTIAKHMACANQEQKRSLSYSPLTRRFLFSRSLSLISLFSQMIQKVDPRVPDIFVVVSFVRDAEDIVIHRINIFKAKV